MSDRSPLRKITVGGDRYLWQRRHDHTGGHCAEKVNVYREGFKKSPLRVTFSNASKLPGASGRNWHVGESQGELGNASSYVNLNRPAVIARLIEFFLAKGWSPAEAQKPFLVEHALPLLEEMNLPAESGS